MPWRREAPIRNMRMISAGEAHVNRMVWIGAAVAAVLACSSQGSRGAAETAIAEAETAITDVHAYALRFAPEEFKAVMKEYAAAREALDREDFRRAAQSAGRATELAKEVSRTATTHRRAFEADWPTLRDTVSGRLDAIDERLAELSTTGILPRGITGDELASAKAAAEEMRRGLEQAIAAYEDGQLRDAVRAATSLRSRAEEVMAQLEMKAGPRA